MVTTLADAGVVVTDDLRTERTFNRLIRSHVPCH